MGQTYSVDLELRIKDEKMLCDLTRDFISKNENRYKFPENAEKRTEIRSLLECIFTQMLDTELEPGHLIADFSGSYGWEAVMTEWFAAVAPAFEEGTRFFIYPDEDYDELIVQDGKAVWLH